MKKFLLPILACVVMLFAGCQKDAHMTTSYYTVHPNQWQADITTFDDGTYVTNFYYSKWENIDITPDVIEHGVVLAYLCNGYDELLPYTYYNMDGNYLWSERIEFDINPNEPGVIYFIIKDSDFNTAQSMAHMNDMNFKVVTIYN